MKTKHITTHSVNEAWSVAADIFPTDYAKDTQRSSRAGYDVYHSTADGVSAWISDLGCRLEVNLPNGDTVNVWIEEDPEAIAEAELDAALAEEAAEEIEREIIAEQIEARKAAERMTPEALFTPTVCQRVTLSVMGGHFVKSEDERKVWEALRRGDSCIEHEVMTAYAETHGIKWGRITVNKPEFISYGKDTDGGHFIIEGFISARIGEELDFLAKCAVLLNRDHEENKERR